jgi:hypothetical protein
MQPVLVKYPPNRYLEMFVTFECIHLYFVMTHVIEFKSVFMQAVMEKYYRIGI